MLRAELMETQASPLGDSEGSPVRISAISVHPRVLPEAMPAHVPIQEQVVAPIEVNLQATAFHLVESRTDDSSIQGRFFAALSTLSLGPSSAYYEYSIRVKVELPWRHPSWEVRKRFSAISDFHDSLSNMTRRLPLLPVKGASRIVTDEFAQYRLSGLNSYFQSLSQIPELMVRMELWNFLEASRNMSDYSKFCNYISTFLPLLTAEIFPTNGVFTLTSLCLNDSIGAMLIGSADLTIVSKLDGVLSAVVGRGVLRADSPVEGQMSLWRRLPNSLLFEQLWVNNLDSAVTCTLLDASAPPAGESTTVSIAFVGTANGNVRFRKFRVRLLGERRDSNGTGETRLPPLEQPTEGRLSGITHTGAINALTLDTDGDRIRWLWTGGSDGLVQAFDLASWKLLSCAAASQTHHAITALTVQSDKRRVFVGLSTGSVAMMDARAMPPVVVAEFDGMGGSVTNLQLRRDSDDIRRLYVSHSSAILSTQLSNNCVQMWTVKEAPDSQPHSRWGPTVAACTCTEIADTASSFSTVIVAATSNGSVTLYRKSSPPEPHCPYRIWKAHDKGIHTCYWWDSQRVLVTGGEDNVVKFWHFPPHDDSDFSSVGKSTVTYQLAVPRDSCLSQPGETTTLPPAASSQPQPYQQQPTTANRSSVNAADDLDSWAR